MSDPIPPSNPSRQPNQIDDSERAARRLARKQAEEQRERYAAWASARGLKESQGITHPSRLVGKRPDTGHYANMMVWGWTDHVHLWLRDGKAVCFTSEPYGLSEQKRRNIQEIAEEYGLVVVIRPPEESPWNPGRTYFVQLWAPGAVSPR